MIGPDAATNGDHDFYGRPSRFELITATRDFLADELLPILRGPEQYKTAIAVRALDTVPREYRLATRAVAGHAARLADLGVDSDAHLVAAIRACRFDRQPDRLLKFSPPTAPPASPPPTRATSATPSFRY